MKLKLLSADVLIIDKATAAGRNTATEEKFKLQGYQS
jgi:hypothetical protein